MPSRLDNFSTLLEQKTTRQQAVDNEPSPEYVFDDGDIMEYSFPNDDYCPKCGRGVSWA